MSRGRKWKLSKDLGLSLGHVTGRYFLGMEELHFGYWPDGLEVDKRNLGAAQTAYSDLLLAQLPSGARTVLEVGCGTGRLAGRLIESGREVDVVSPSSYLTRVAREHLGDRAGFFECRFEELETARRWDLVLFSESFQYVEPGVGLGKAAALLKPGGRVLICDYFRLPAEERSPIGGGRDWGEFQRELAEAPFEIETELDLTEGIAPGFAVLRDLDLNLVAPGYRAVLDTLARDHPLLLRFLRWRYRRKLARFEAGIADGHRGPEAFRRFKTYRLLVLKPELPAALEGR